MSNYLNDDDLADELRQENESLRQQLAEARKGAKSDLQARDTRTDDEASQALLTEMSQAKSREELTEVLDRHGLIAWD